MSERPDANLFEVMIVRSPKDREIDIILGKALGVLGHAELVEPVRNFLHCAASLRWSLGPLRHDIRPTLRRELPLSLGHVRSLKDLGARRREHCRPQWVGECP